MRFQTTRRALLALVMAASAVGATTFPGFAAAPKVRTQAPGFYRFMVGDFEVTALSDGTVDLPVEKILTGTTPDAVLAALKAAYLQSPLRTSDNAYLVNTGEKLVLVDTGAGSLFGPTLGKLLVNLAASGYRPEQVDEVLITHMHPDHIGGLAADGKAVFPNATVRAGKADADMWLNPANLAAAPDEQKSFFSGPIAAFSPYQASNRFAPFETSGEILPGVKSVDLAGHTKGHSGYMVESKGERLLIWGDVVHVASVQFADPAVTIAFDTDAAAAAAARSTLFKDATSAGTLIAGAHLPFPGVGHIRAAGDAFEWIPINYSSTP